MEYRNSFENYAYLWVDDRQEFLRQFLLYGHVLTAEEIEAAGEEGVAETPPTLSQYKEQVDTYEQIYSAVEQFEVCSLCFVRIKGQMRESAHVLTNLMFVNGKGRQTSGS